jgi:hypothetical protein
MTRRAGALVQWFRDQELLRGPFLFVDYWANVLGIDGITPGHHARRGFIHPGLFRLGVDRPELEVPRLVGYLLLFLIGPLVFVFKSFRRMGRYRLRFGGGRSQEVQDALRQYRLTLDAAGREPDEAGDPDLPPRCDVRIGDTVLARDILDPYRVAGYSSLFWASNKLPLASLLGLLVIGIGAPVLAAMGLLELTARFWAPVGFPLLVLILYGILRDGVTAVLGGIPILLGTFIFNLLRPSTTYDWSVFFWALAGVFALYLLADWFFMPRSVPPALLLYTRDGPAHPYERKADAPWWLEGECYWVWRYLLLSRAELNKFWERDWERVDLWVRADGPDAGQLEWVVTDLHYRELWIPYDKLGEPASLERQRAKARQAADSGAGIWLVEVDADLVFHSPILRGVTFLPDTGGVPVRGVGHLARSLWRRLRDDDVDDAMTALARVRAEHAVDVLGDIPEIISRRAEVRILREPWTYWRYPLGAARRREPLVYGAEQAGDPPGAAEPGLQVKATGRAADGAGPG